MIYKIYVSKAHTTEEHLTGKRGLDGLYTLLDRTLTLFKKKIICLFENDLQGSSDNENH